MAGHNKWSTIKNKKGKEDAKREKIFTKLGRIIAVAVKEGGPDPGYNAALKAAIEKAKAENMPNDNIERAIKKASGAGETDNFEAITYEGYGPEGIAVIVNCLTDNKNRTAADIRHAFDKCGGNLGQSGSVQFLFTRHGMLVLDAANLDEEEVMADAIETGAEDFIVYDEVYNILTSPENFADVRDALGEKYSFETADLVYLPVTETEISDEENRENMSKLIEMLEDNDDVQDVFHNWNAPDEEE